jgi:hypothetical protein
LAFGNATHGDQAHAVVVQRLLRTQTQAKKCL